MLTVLFLSMLLHQPVMNEAGDPLPPGAIKRLGSTRWRTIGPASCEMTFSNDGKTLYLFGGYEGRARALDVATGKERFQLETPDDQRLIQGALSQDGRWIVCHGYCQSSDEERRITAQGTHLFDAQTGRYVRTWKEKSQSHVALSGDGSLVARCVHQDSGEHVHVTNIASDEELYQWHEGKGSGVLSLRFSADNTQLYVIKYAHESGKAMTLYVVDATTGKTESERVLERTKNITYHGICAPDSLLAYYDHANRQIRVEELLTGKVRQLLPFKPGNQGEGIPFLKGGDDEAGPNVGLTFSRDGSLLAVTEGAHGGSATISQQLLLYDTKTWKQKQSWSLETRWLGHAAMSPDNKTLAVGGSSNSIMLFDTETGRQRNEAVKHNPPGDIRGVCFSADGNWLALVGHDPVIELWNARTWTMKQRWKASAVLNNTSAFTPDGSRLLTGGFGSAAQVWEVPSGKPLTSIKTPGMMTISAAWLDQGKTIALGGHGQHPLRLYEAESGKELKRHQTSGSNLSVFSPNGQYWMNHQQLIRTRNGEAVAAVPISEQSTIYQIGYTHQTLLTVNAKEITTIYECATMQQRWQAQQPSIVSAFSADGRWLASSRGWGHYSKPTTITIRDALTGTVRCEFAGHAALQRLVFSPDGRYLVSAGSDGTALVWQLPDPSPGKPWSENEARDNWNTLAGDNTTKAAQAIARFLDTPQETTDFLRKHLSLVVAADAENVKANIALLADARFADREKAFQELKQLGLLAESHLRKSLNGQLEAEPRRRVEMLLTEIQTLQLTSAERQALRAAEIALRINTPESLKLLKFWSGGAAGARLTRMAQECLGP